MGDTTSNGVQTSTSPKTGFSAGKLGAAASGFLKLKKTAKKIGMASASLKKMREVDMSQIQRYRQDLENADSSKHLEDVEKDVLMSKLGFRRAMTAARFLSEEPDPEDWWAHNRCSPNSS